MTDGVWFRNNLGGQVYFEPGEGSGFVFVPKNGVSLAFIPNQFVPAADHKVCGCDTCGEGQRKCFGRASEEEIKLWKGE